MPLLEPDLLARVESQRVGLELQIAKLKKALRYWQTLEIDYEGLREEISILPSTASTDDCLKAARAFSSELVDEKELKMLVDGNNRQRTPQQLADVFEKRVEYVSKNVTSARTQLKDLERKRNAILLAQDPEHQDEAGLPLTEITEQLDDDGHVISSTVESADAAIPKLTEVLEKVGIATKTNSVGGKHVEKASQDVDQVSFDTEKPRPLEPTAPSLDVVVSGADQQKISVADVRAETVLLPRPASSDVNRSTKVQDTSLHPRSNPYDTEEEADLRREMVEYGLNEVGNVVAELDLIDDTSDVSYDGDDLDDLMVGSDVSDELDEFEDEDSDEDERGMSRRSGISNSYRKQMEALKQKLGADDMQNVGPELHPEEIRPPAAHLAGKAALARAEALKRVQQTDIEAPVERKSKKTSKKVAFASELDIAPQESRSMPDLVKEPVNFSETAPVISETVAEHHIDQPASALPPQPPSVKVSRFRAARQQSENDPILDNALPADHLMSHGLVERPPTIRSTNESESINNTPSAPTDSSSDISAAQIRSEYYGLRNKFIQKQGGFSSTRDAVYDHPTDSGDLNDNSYEAAIEPIPDIDPRTGREVKVSRFKAARLRQ